MDIDFSNIFNIIFIAAAGALIVFMLASVITVAVKGKRRPNAFDVILRIIASLAILVTAVMGACIILTMLEGDYRLIAVAPAPPILLFGGEAIEIPAMFTDLFALLPTTLCSNLVTALLICSIAALIVDCLVANKKRDGKKSAATKKAGKKTEAQLRREAEIARIRKLGELAVQKTDSVAAAAKNDTVTAKTSEQTPEPTIAEDDEPIADWRNPVEQKQETHAEFVGIVDTVSDPDFDTFDDVEQDNEKVQSSDDSPEPENPEADDAPQAESDEPTTDNVEPELEAEDIDNAWYAQGGDDMTDDAAQTAQAETDDIAYDNDDDFSQATDEQYMASAAQSTETTDTASDFDDEPEDEDIENAWYAQGGDDMIADAAQTAQAETDGMYFDGGATTATTYDEYANVQPDRNIYIPKVRTVVKRSVTVQTKRESKTSTVKSTSTAKKKTESKSATASKSVTTAAKKPTAAKKSAATEAKAKPTAKKQTATKKPAASGTSKSKPATTAKKSASTSAEKKLPVTRRYIILDRRNAVNMFGEYLKERNKADKDKLESSINTIIIE